MSIHSAEWGAGVPGKDLDPAGPEGAGLGGEREGLSAEFHPWVSGVRMCSGKQEGRERWP